MNFTAMLRSLAGTVLLLACTGAMGTVWAFDHTHRNWDTLLKRHVVWISGGTASQVDYAGFKGDALALQAYLDSLSDVRQQTFNAWSSDERLAFLINAYNAFTVQLVLTRYPDLKSIKDLGSFFSSPWKKRFVPLLGEVRSLDEIEHGMIRKPGVYDESRIHFAVNCASIGCPALRDEAFVAAYLNEQLEDALVRFLSDKSRNRYASDSLEVSRIFDWYREDFERESGSVNGFLSRYAQVLADTEAARTRIRDQSPPIRFLRYDWRLNGVSDAPPPPE